MIDELRKQEISCNDCYLSMQNCHDMSICCEDETGLCDWFEPIPLNVDTAFHMIHRQITNGGIKWNDFRKVGVEEDYHDYYYAEDELYVIRDRIFNRLTLVKARSPKEAMEKFNSEVEAVFGGNDDE